MSDLPIDHDKKPLTLEERVNVLEGDIQEVARGVNIQGSLLEAIVIAFETVVRKYLRLTNRESNGDPEKK